MKKVFLIAALSVSPLALACGTHYFLPYSTRERGFIDEKEASFAKEGVEYRMLAWRNENGEIPANPLAEPIVQRAAWLASQTESSGFSNGGAARLNWTPRGPQNVGGRTRSLLIHPTDTNIMWAGSVSGGVWKTTDGGLSWFAGNNTLGNFAIGSMALHPTNPNILFAGTGEGFFNFDALQGDGLYRSLDGGLTWARLINTSMARHINRIAIDPNSPSRMLIATSGAGDSGEFKGGIWESDDGGATWEENVITNANNAQWVGFHPTNGSIAVAEVIFGCTAGKCHRVVYTDPETEPPSWKTAKIRNNSQSQYTDFVTNGELEGRIELAFGPATSNVVYALFPGDIGGRSGILARSDDNGANFTIVQPATPSPSPTPVTQIGPSYYNNTLWVSPNDANFVVAGAVLLHRSTDGGATFDTISYYSGVDHHCIVEDPNFAPSPTPPATPNRRVFICVDGGLSRNNDIAATGVPSWTSLN